MTTEESFDEMSNDINGLLSQFKTNMMNNGVTVESSDKFKSLIDKIATIPVGLKLTPSENLILSIGFDTKWVTGSTAFVLLGSSKVCPYAGTCRIKVPWSTADYGRGGKVYFEQIRNNEVVYTSEVQNLSAYGSSTIIADISIVPGDYFNIYGCQNNYHDMSTTCAGTINIYGDIL